MTNAEVATNLVNAFKDTLRLDAQQWDTPHAPLQWFRDRRNRGTIIFLSLWPLRPSFMLCVPWEPK